MLAPPRPCGWSVVGAIDHALFSLNVRFWLAKSLTRIVSPRTGSNAIAGSANGGGSWSITCDHSGCSSRQCASQPSLEYGLPSSQTSFAGSTTPLPHFSLERQSAEQPSLETVFPSSHISAGTTPTSPGSTRRSPHAIGTHAPS